MVYTNTERQALRISSRTERAKNLEASLDTRAQFLRYGNEHQPAGISGKNQITSDC